jgi:hypothetical protein
MTTSPKEKAQALVDKFRNELSWIERDYKVDLWRDAKQCAALCIQEIIEVLDEISIGESGTTKIDYGQSFYEQVKIELNSL